MTELMPGLHHLKVPIPDNPLGHTNVYLLGGEDPVLIDAGWNSETAFDALTGQLEQTGVRLEQISRVIVTHAHLDHYGLAGKIREASGARIAMHEREGDLVKLRDMSVPAIMQDLIRWLLANGVPQEELAGMAAGPGGRLRSAQPPPLPDIMLRDGENIGVGDFALTVVWTPGHSPGHICLYERGKKLLFAGDHILPVITPNISLQPFSRGNPLGEFVESLEKVKRLEVEMVFPAHEHPFTGLQARVDEIVEHHRNRNLEIMATIRGTARTAYQISTEITWMPELGGARFEALAPWDRRLAVMEALAHLEALTVDGRVRRSARDGIMYYEAV